MPIAEMPIPTHKRSTLCRSHADLFGMRPEVTASDHARWYGFFVRAAGYAGSDPGGRGQVRSFFLASTISVVAAAGASAADLPIYTKAPPPPAPIFSWTGFYLGGNAGGAWGRDQITTTLTAPPGLGFPIDLAAVSNAASPTISPFGFIGGVQAGYNQQLGHWVWGGEVDFDYLGLKGSNGGTLPFPSTLPGGPLGPPTSFFSTATSMSTNWLFTARPRLGWAADHWLVYVTGGLAVGQENFSQTITLLGPTFVNSNFSTTRAGWTVGAGVEYAFNQKWSVKGEYLHVDLGSVGTNGTFAPPVPGFGSSGSVRLTTEIARAGINYRF